MDNSLLTDLSGSAVSFGFIVLLVDVVFFVAVFLWQLAKASHYEDASDYVEAEPTIAEAAVFRGIIGAGVIGGLLVLFGGVGLGAAFLATL